MQKIELGPFYIKPSICTYILIAQFAKNKEKVFKNNSKFCKTFGINASLLLLLQNYEDVNGGNGKLQRQKLQDDSNPFELPDCH